MSKLFEELDYRTTPLGDLFLRRRRHMGLDADIYEIKLGNDFLMSSMFTASELALGRLGVERALSQQQRARPDAAHLQPTLNVVVGGLGLGYTAAAVLESEATSTLCVVEYLEPVIEWHRQGLLPTSLQLTEDARCSFLQGDFFALAVSAEGFDPVQPGRRYDAILVDIDHSPEQWLNPGNESFYHSDGLRRMKGHLNPGGVFGLWSNEPADPEFTQRLATVFGAAYAEAVVFHNPLQNRDFAQSVYIATAEPNDGSPYME
ncbi:MAG: spermidine synthase [Spirochaetaceae bacterium]|nr:MAG: spermidine synthase [Spirochaetaceae bacterium]